MDETQESAEPTQADIREQIGETRSALTDKLEALEDHVKDTVTSARETIQESAHATRETVAETIQSVKSSVRETVTAVKNVFDVRLQVQRHPRATVGGAMLAGLALGKLLNRVPGRSRPIPGHVVRSTDRPPVTDTNTAVHRGNGSARGATAIPPIADAREVHEPRFLDQFQEEVDQVKAMALGWAMGLVRDSLEDALPKFASQIDKVMDSVTAKLGGNPLPHKET